MTAHRPVLLEELIDLLQPIPNETFVDATLGGAGMAHVILRKIAPAGIVYGLEQDKKAIARIKPVKRLVIRRGNFRDIDKLVPENISVNGIYFDLGISSDQLADEHRGISFQHPDAPLDMRMDTSTGFTAAQLLNASREEDLVNVFSKYGQETRSKSVAKAIVASRKQKPLVTVQDLLDCIKQVYPKSYYPKHPGTKVWQALRIAVNDELSAIEEALPKAFTMLTPGGRMAVISFHSLEDRIVKQFIKTKQKEGAAILLNKKVIVPTKTETKSNPRARSAKLRGIQKETKQ